MKLQLLGTKVAILLDGKPKEQKTEAGIIIPVTEQKKENVVRGTVSVLGLKCESGLKVGDRVLILTHQGTDIDHEDYRIKILHEDSVMAIIEE